MINIAVDKNLFYSIIKIEEIDLIMSKFWKRLLFIILIIACLYNIISKLITKMSFEQEINSSVDYVMSVQNSNWYLQLL